MKTSKLVREQCQSKTRIYTRKGIRYKSTVNYKLDDQCGNGHNTFSVTMDTYRQAKNGRWVEDAYGCQHEEVKKLFPFLVPFLKWHLTSTNEPMHYIANTVFHASNRDGWGLLKGKERNLDAARSCAVWPDATDEDLTAPGLEDRLQARHSALMDEFAKDMEALGFVY